MMKKLGISFIFISFFTFALASTNLVNAKTSNTESYSSESSTGNNYFAGEEETFKSDIDGDLYALGGKLIIEGDINDNAMLLAGEVLIEGDIKGDITVLGGYIVVNGDIKGDLRILGGEVYINSKEVGGDLLVSGGIVEVSKDTKVLGEDKISGEDIDTNATNLPDDLSESKAFKSMNFNSNDFSDFAKGVTLGSLILSVIGIVASFVMSYFVLKLFPVFSENVLKTMKKRLFLSTGVGCLTMIVAPIIGLFLLFSLIGYKLFFLLFVLAILSYFLSQTYVKYLIGRFILETIGMKHTGRLQPLLVGVLVIDLGFFIIAFVPFVGPLFVAIASMALGLWGIGGIVLAKFSKMENED